MEITIWKDIPGYEGCYQASEDGKIKSIERFISNHTGQRKLKERILIFKVNRSGYLVCNLYKDGKKKDHFVHYLIYLTFYGTYDKTKYQIDHVNDIKTDNRKENLTALIKRANMSKRSMKREKTSKYSNVHWHKGTKRWVASLKSGTVTIFHKYFKTEEEANQAVIDVLDQIHENTDTTVTNQSKSRFIKATV